MFMRTLTTSRFYHKIGVVGVPFNKGQTKNGVEKAPDSLRAAGLLTELAQIRKNNPSMDVKDYGNVKYDLKKNFDVENMLNWSDVAECNRKLSEQVGKVLKDNRKCLTIGGDHSIALGSIDGHMNHCKPENLAVIWVDAHADINTQSSSHSGNVHGMPMALLATELQDEWPYLPLVEWQRPLLSLKNLAYIGLRSVDSYELQTIDKFNVTAFDMKDVQNFGIKNVIQMALNKIDPDGNCSLHVSFDIDSLDSLEAPSTGTPVRGGLTLREGIEIMETVCETGRLNVVDLVEFNPQIGSKKDVEITIQAAKEIIFAAFGHRRRGFKSISKL